MSETTDLLDAVISALEKRRGELPAVARASGVSYDTVHRIKAREGGVSYASLRALSEALGLRVKITQK